VHRENVTPPVERERIRGTRSCPDLSRHGRSEGISTRPSLQDERSGGPRAAQILERKLPQDAHRLIREQPRRRPERARAASESLSYDSNPEEPLPDPPGPFPREVSCTPGGPRRGTPPRARGSLFPGKGRKAEAISGGKERPYSAVRKPYSRGVRAEHLDEKRGFAGAGTRPSPSCPAEGEEERRGCVERAERVEQGRDAALHPAPRVDVDLEPRMRLVLILQRRLASARNASRVFLSAVSSDLRLPPRISSRAGWKGSRLDVLVPSP